MADERIIDQADLSRIANNLAAINSSIEYVDSSVNQVGSNVMLVNNEVTKLATEFHQFVDVQLKANRLGQAETRLVKIRQEIEKKFGHYDIVRRTTTGILQADDLGIIKRDTISNATEELMISTPGYWLAPCLVALSAWINDDKELAERAVKEAIRRDDEKTSLFFALVCRRSNRKAACLKWTQRYLANQDEEDLDRKTIIVLDAYASGLLGVDTEGVISKQMDEWLERIEAKPGFVEEQTKQWTDAINMKKKPISNGDSYTYLSKYSRTWPVINEVLEGAELHGEMYEYLKGIFDQESPHAEVKKQLDDILDRLVTGFDDEELPLRKEEKFEQFVVDFNGDEKRAKHNMTLEETAFDTHKNFTQLLTDAAMKPESSHSSVSTQKFAFSLSKEWVLNAYNDIVANNRMKIPNEIEINVDTFNDVTVNGDNENELIDRFVRQVDDEEKNALKDCTLSGFDKFSLFGGIGILAIGIFMLMSKGGPLSIIAIIAGIAFTLNYFSKKKKMDRNIQNVKDNFNEKRSSGTQVIRATLAEVVDFRMEFAEKDSESAKVIDFLNQITPDQYVKKLSDSNRRIIMKG